MRVVKTIVAWAVPLGLVWAVVAMVGTSTPSSEMVFQKLREGDHAALRSYVRADAGVVAWRDPAGYTPLHWAAATNDAAAARLLLGAGADCNARDDRGRTPLHLASMSQMRGDEKLMAVLIEFGADVNAADRDGVTPLEFARRLERPDLSQTLLAAGATPLPATEEPAPITPDERLADGSATPRKRFAFHRPNPARRWVMRRAFLRPPPHRIQPADERVDG